MQEALSSMCWMAVRALALEKRCRGTGLSGREAWDVVLTIQALGPALDPGLRRKVLSGVANNDRCSGCAT